MAKGGARARSGPAPDPQALRRDRKDDAAGWLTLPAEGRKGATPEWPLSEASDRELALWVREWRRPQAVEWERNGQELEVGMYVRSLVAAEAPDAVTAARAEVRRMQEALGLSLPGLARNRWRIADAPGELAPTSAAASARGRFKVVPGGRDASAA